MRPAISRSTRPQGGALNEALVIQRPPDFNGYSPEANLIQESSDVAFGNRASPTISRRKQALRYARRGWRVLPLHTAAKAVFIAAGQICDHPGKHPRTPQRRQGRHH